MHAPNTEHAVPSMEKSPPPLSPLQLQAISLLVAGHSHADVARTLNIARATLYRWQENPVFAAYLNQHLRSRQQEALTISSLMLTESLAFVRAKLADPNTPLETQLKIAFRIISLYSRPSYLKHLHDLPDEAQAVCEQQFHDRHRIAGNSEMVKHGIETFDPHHQDQLKDMERYIAESQAAVPAQRDTMRQNETLSAPHTPAPTESGVALRHPKSPVAIATDSILANLTTRIAAAVTG